MQWGWTIAIQAMRTYDGNPDCSLSSYELSHPSSDNAGEAVPITIIDEVDVWIQLQRTHDARSIPLKGEDVTGK